MSAEKTTQTRSATTTVECEGYCDDPTRHSESLDVVAGHITAEGNDTVAVTGADGGGPVVQTWCPDCSEERFGVGRGADGRSSVATVPYVTGRTVAAFVLGVALTLVAASLFIV